MYAVKEMHLLRVARNEVKLTLDEVSCGYASAMRCRISLRVWQRRLRKGVLLKIYIAALLAKGNAWAVFRCCGLLGSL